MIQIAVLGSVTEHGSHSWNRESEGKSLRAYFYSTYTPKRAGLRFMPVESKYRGYQGYEYLVIDLAVENNRRHFER